jgi:hypothetical protein
MRRLLGNVIAQISSYAVLVRDSQLGRKRGAAQADDLNNLTQHLVAGDQSKYLFPGYDVHCGAMLLILLSHY